MFNVSSHILGSLTDPENLTRAFPFRGVEDVAGAAGKEFRRELGSGGIGFEMSS